MEGLEEFITCKLTTRKLDAVRVSAGACSRQERTAFGYANVGVGCYALLQEGGMSQLAGFVVHVPMCILSCS